MFVGTMYVGTWQRQSHDRSDIILEHRIEDAGAKKSAGDSLEIFDVSPRDIGQYQQIDVDLACNPFF
jgi:hypothetical protein